MYQTLTNRLKILPKSIIQITNPVKSIAPSVYNDHGLGNERRNSVIQRFQNPAFSEADLIRNSVNLICFKEVWNEEP